MKNILKKEIGRYILQYDAIEIDLAMETSNLNILETELFAKSINLLNLNSEGKGEIILDACDIDEKRFGDRVSKKFINGHGTLEIN